MVMSAKFAAEAAGTLDFDANNMATPDEDEAFETAGTYNGAMGTYRCDGDAVCTVTLDAMGAVTGSRRLVGSSLPIRVPPLTSRITTTCPTASG